MSDVNTMNYKDPFINKLVKFVGAEEFQNMFENFFIKYSLEFTNAPEHQLRYYELYEKFKDLFEEKLNIFCQQMKINQTEFFQRCKSAVAEDEKAANYIEILLSSVEYETFVKLMRIMRPVAEKRRLTVKKAEEKDISGGLAAALKKTSPGAPRGRGAGAKLSKAVADTKEADHRAKRGHDQMDEDDDSAAADAKYPEYDDDPEEEEDPHEELGAKRSFK